MDLGSTVPVAAPVQGPQAHVRQASQAWGWLLALDQLDVHGRTRTRSKTSARSVLPAPH